MSATATQPKAARLADRRRDAPADPPPLEHDRDLPTKCLSACRAGNIPAAARLCPDELVNASRDAGASDRCRADHLSALEHRAGVVACDCHPGGERAACHRPARRELEALGHEPKRCGVDLVVEAT